MRVWCRLKGLPKLQSLALDETKVSDAGLVRLKAGPHLKLWAWGKLR